MSAGQAPARRAGRGKYAPYAAQKRAELRGRRPKVSKFENLELASLVQEKLCVKWSPEQISNHLATAFADRAEMRVCPETIYQALYVQGRGHLRADLHQHLRTGRAVRRPRRSTTKGPSGKIPGMIMISERPAGVERPGRARTLGISMLLSSGDRYFGCRGFLVGGVVAEHGPDDVDPAAGWRDEGLFVGFAFGAFAVVEAPGGGLFFRLDSAAR